MRRALALIAAVLLAACAPKGPLDIDTKADVCSVCRMSIDSLAHAGEILTSDGSVRKHDSLGCLLDDYRALAKAGTRLAGAWVVDYGTHAWVKAEDAYYALVELQTDHMGFGAAATATREAALKLASGDATRVASWKGLQSWKKP